MSVIDLDTLEQCAYFDLLDVIKKQNEVITQQGELIAKLTNERAEQENLIKYYFNEARY